MKKKNNPTYEDDLDAEEERYFNALEEDDLYDNTDYDDRGPDVSSLDDEDDVDPFDDDDKADSDEDLINENFTLDGEESAEYEDSLYGDEDAYEDLDDEKEDINF